jgi:hypothetical protein
MKLRTFFSFALFALTACNVENAVVGGKCRAGFSESKGNCVRAADSDDSSPSANDGFANGGPSLGEEPGQPSNGQPSGGAASALFDRDAGLTTSTTDRVDVVDVIVPATLRCDAPLVACRGACIPVASDGDNCGACGKICPSNICIDGECQGALAGDVVVLGHEYASSWSTSAQAKMIANAVSIPTTDPIRVLAFDGDHLGAAAERALIAASVKFRGVSYTTANDAALEATDLARKYDVVLVHGAGSAPSELGARWSSALETFTKKGGVVVALDDGKSDMPALLTASGLLAIEGHTSLAAGTQVVVAKPNDAVGTQVLSPFAPFGASVGFFGVQSSSDVTIVAHTNDDAAFPTAIHRFVR